VSALVSDFFLPLLAGMSARSGWSATAGIDRARALHRIRELATAGKLFVDRARRRRGSCGGRDGRDWRARRGRKHLYSADVRRLDLPAQAGRIMSCSRTAAGRRRPWRHTGDRSSCSHVFNIIAWRSPWPRSSSRPVLARHQQTGDSRRQTGEGSRAANRSAEANSCS